MDDKQQIIALLLEQEAATSRGNAAGVIAPLAEDIVSYDLPPPLEYRGTGARHAGGLERWFATWEDGVTSELSDPTVLVDGNLAVAFGLVRLRGTKKGGGPVDSWNRRTVVLQRRQDRWQIVHEHASYPMRMDGSEKAALDLTPGKGAE